MLKDRAALHPDWKHWNDWTSHSVSNLHTACALDFINWLSLNKRGMNSSNVLRARSWDGFHKQITQVVHVWERRWSTGWEACCCNHYPASAYFRSPLCVLAKVSTSAEDTRIWFTFSAVRHQRPTLRFGTEHVSREQTKCSWVVCEFQLWPAVLK